MMILSFLIGLLEWFYYKLWLGLIAEAIVVASWFRGSDNAHDYSPSHQKVPEVPNETNATTNTPRSFPTMAGVLTASCRCGDCVLHLTLVAAGNSSPCDNLDATLRDTAAVDCHCPSCRKYHTTAFVSYVRARIESNDDDSATIPWQSFRHQCAQLGTVDRYFCPRCYAKLATLQVGDDQNQNNDIDCCVYYVNMGSLVDESIEADYSAAWRTLRRRWQVNDPSRMSPWYPAHPDYVAPNNSNNAEESGDCGYDGSGENIDCSATYKDEMTTTTKATPPSTITSPLTLQGSCACGAARYQVQNWTIPNHMPHCYCHLCRYSSGSAFLSWMYCSTTHFSWITAEPLRIRTTNMAFRHVCGTCSGNLTVIYDEEAKETMWPTVGSINDDSWRKVRSLSRQQQQRQLESLSSRETRYSHSSPAAPLGGCADGCLDYVSHIYCAFRPQWYALPDDGLPRWDE